MFSVFGPFTPAAQAAPLALSLTSPTEVYASTTRTTQTIPVSYAPTGSTTVQYSIVGNTAAIKAATCSAGATPIQAEVLGGILLVNDPIAATVPSASCDLLIDFAPGVVPSVTNAALRVEERDNFGQTAAVGTKSYNVHWTDASVVAAPLMQALVPFNANVPHKVGDVVSYGTTITYAGIPAGSGVVTTAPGTNYSAGTNTVSRSLTAADYTSGRADISTKLTYNGFVLAEYDPMLEVFAENRLVVTTAANPSTVKAGTRSSVTVTTANVGTTVLTGVVTDFGPLANNLAEATCLRGAAPVAPSSVNTLQPGESVVCTFDHLAESDEAATAVQLKARGTQPFGTDDDRIDHDSTSASDVDGADTLALNIVPVDVTFDTVLSRTALVSPQPAAASVVASVEFTALDPLANASLSMPLSPAPGVTLTTCPVNGAAGMCTLSLGTIDDDLVHTFNFTYTIAPGAIVGGEVPFVATLRSAGGITLTAPTAVLKTGGIEVSSSHRKQPTTAPHGAVEELTISITGAAQDVAFIPPAGVTIEECSAASVNVPLRSLPNGRVGLGVRAVGEVTCNIGIDVSDAAATAGTLSAVLPVESKLSTASLIQNHQLRFDITRLKIEQGAIDAVPTHGYAVASNNPRGLPTSISSDFTIELDGDFTSGNWSVTPVTTGTTVSCPALTPTLVLVATPGTPAKLACRVTREISLEELNDGQRATASVRIESEHTDPTTKTLVMPIPIESMDITTREVSSPIDAGGYRVGDTVRWLVVVKNYGDVPVTIDSLGLSRDGLSTLRTGGGSAALGNRVGSVSECTLPATLAPGQSLTCTLSYVVSVPDVLSGSINLSVLAGSTAPAQAQAAVRVLTTTAQARQELPATGGSARDTLAVAAALLCVGLFLRRRAARAA
jgi:hypothetical protein